MGGGGGKEEALRLGAVESQVRKSKGITREGPDATE